MSLNAGTVQATAEVNMRRFSQGMKQMHREGDRASKQVQHSLGGIGSKLRSISFIAQTVFASGLVMGARKSVREFALLEGSLAKFEVVFAGQSREMQAWVDTLRTRLPLANREIIAAAASMQDLLVPMGVAREQATGMTQQWLELAAALAAFNDVPVDQALEAIRSGIAGQSRPLRQFGIDVRETALQQTALEEGLIKTGEAMDDVERQQALLLQAYKQSQDAIDGYEDQLGSTLMMEQELGATFKDTMALIGEGLDPAYKNLLERLTQVLNITQELVRAKGLLSTAMNITEWASGVKAVKFMGGAMLDYTENITNAIRATREFNNSIEAALMGDMNVDELAQFASKLSNEMTRLSSIMEVQGGGTEEQIKRFERLQGIAYAIGGIISNISAEIKETPQIDVISPEELASLDRAQKALAQIRKDSALIEPVSDIIDLDAELFERVSWHMNQFGSTFEDAMRSVRSSPPDFEAFMDSIWDTSLSAEELEHRLELIKEATNDASGAAQFFSRTLADGLDQVLFRARSVEDAIKGIIRQLASRALTTGLMALLGGGLGGVSFGRAMFGGTFHTGGVVPGVGEKMINVQGGEAVLTKDQVKSLGSGSAQRIELTVNVRGGTQLSGKDLRYVIDEQVRQSVRLQ